VNSNTKDAIDQVARDSLKRDVVHHYESQLRQHGPTARGMNWKDEASQTLRFRILCEIRDLNGLSLHEVGAGAGHLYDYLRTENIDADYSGSDLSEDMVQAAKLRHPHVCFDRRDILVDPDLPEYDVLVCSGLFFVRLHHTDGDWQDFIYATIRRMYDLCRIGIAFNLMTDQVDFRADNLYYSDPGQTLNFCRRELSRSVVVRHDYPLYEYTTYVYRNSSH
jgi:hypothetical protein